MAFDQENTRQSASTLTLSKYQTAGTQAVDLSRAGGSGRGDRIFNVGVPGDVLQNVVEGAYGAVREAGTQAGSLILGAFDRGFGTPENQSTQRAYGYAALALAAGFALWWYLARE